MTTHPKRRSRRPAAALAALALLASVLAAVTAMPAHAANTSSEALLDTNNDGTGDAREFGGRDRYDTALRLAKNFGQSKGLGGVGDVFVASGETLVDAVSVSGLAGYLDAPVVLTYKDSLPGAVADFLEDYGIANVHVLGGEAAVSAAVFEQLQALDHSPTVARIQGADRYATATEVAARLSDGGGGGSVWCGGSDKAAILTNGGDVSLAYAMLVGPIASRLQLPVLLTAHDELPTPTRDVISDQDFEHVVIVGGTSSVSAGIAGDLSAAGVDTITRIDGDTPADASAALAKLATNGCRGDLAGVSTDTVALVAERGLPDGVAASPVLASSYRSGLLVPMLVVGDSLPGSISSYLAGTAEEDAAGNKTHIEIVAIGGTAAVTSGVMAAALNATASAPALSVEIVSTVDWDLDGDKDDTPRAGETKFLLKFSDNIVGGAADSAATQQLRARLLDVLRIGNVPAVLALQNANPAGVVFGGGAANCKPDEVTVNLASPLVSRQSISIADTALKFGDDGDRRPLKGDTVSVVNKETTGPSFEIVSIVGQKTFTVIARDTGFPAPTGLANGETLTTAEVTVASGNTTANPLRVNSNGVSGGSVSVPDDGKVLEHTFTVTMSRKLVSGDTIKIAKDAIKDEAGNGNSEHTSPGPVAATPSPEASVSVSSPLRDVQAKYAVPSALTGGDGSEGGTEDVFFVAKPNGNAAGANGNRWTFDFRRASTYNANRPVSIEVFVNAVGKRAFVTFADGKPKFADLATALNSHRGFSSLWEVSIDNSQNTCAPSNKAITVPTTTTTTQSGDQAVTGNTKMAIQATFTGYVRTVKSSALLDAVLDAADTRNGGLAVKASIGLSNSGTTETGPIRNVKGPVRTVRYIASTNDESLLPRNGDKFTVAQGAIADGYADDDSDTSDADERLSKAQTDVSIGSGAAQPQAGERNP